MLSAVRAVLRDVRQGWRLTWRSPAFTAAAVLTLALGIGANSAIFSLLNILSLKPLPYRDPSRVAFVLGRDIERGEDRFNLSLADYLDVERRSKTLEPLAAYTYLSANLTGGDVPERAQAYRVTGNTFAMLGVPAALGRVLGPDDARDGHADVVVISHGMWQRRFGGEAGVVGRRVMVNGAPHRIVGVMPPRFEYPVFNFKGDLWIPWTMPEGGRGQASGSHSAVVVGRLRPGISYAQAQAELDVIMRTLAAEHPDTNEHMGARLVEMGRLDDEQAGPATSIVVATAALVLLLACANVANLLLARGASRRRELAVRAALGAGRLQIARQLLVEVLLLAMAGGVLGILLAGFALQALRAALPEAVLTTMPNVQELGVDRPTLVYTLVISMLASMAAGVVPAWRAARGDLHDGLRESASSGGSRGTRRLRTILVVGEVALATLLLVAAGLLVRSYRGLQHVDPGFAPDGLLTLTTALPEDKYPDAPRQLQFYEDSLRRIARLPGVRSAGYVNVLPFSTYDRGARLIVEGQPVPEPGREPEVSFRVASPGYVEALRIPVLAGRSFGPHDHADAARVAIVNRTLASRFLGTRPPVGRRVRLGRDESSPWLTIVGVIGDVHHWRMSQAPDPEIYVPMAQTPTAMMMLAVRGEGDAGPLLTAIRGELRAVDPNQPVYHVGTMNRLIGNAMLPESTSAALMTLFGGLALLLAAVGVYGVVAYGVSQQTREFGVRLALGATPGNLLALVLRNGITMVGTGVALGGAGALAASRLLAGALHGVSPFDPATYLFVVGLLGGTALVACSVPARRASKVEPVRALHVE